MGDIVLPYFCIEGNPFITRFKTSYRKTFGYEDTFVCGIEGNPFITRFKTSNAEWIINPLLFGIEGNPFITRFKTFFPLFQHILYQKFSIEGNPFITRFKTAVLAKSDKYRKEAY